MNLNHGSPDALGQGTGFRAYETFKPFTLCGIHDRTPFYIKIILRKGFAVVLRHMPAG